MDKRTKLGLTAIAVSIGVALIFGNPVVLPEYRDRKPVDVKKAKADLDVYIARTRQNQVVRAQAATAVTESVAAAATNLMAEADEMATTKLAEQETERMRADLARQSSMAQSQAAAQNPSVPAVQAATPTVAAVATREQEIEAKTFDAQADDSTQAPTAAVDQPKIEPAQKTEVMQIERREVTSQFLYLKVREHTLRFHVAKAVDAQRLEKIVATLKNACLATSESDLACTKSKQPRVIVDRLFFAELKMSEVSEFSQSSTANGSLWKLTGGTSNQPFRITQDSSVSRSEILARGFESQILGVNPKRKPASQAATKIEKVYVTQSRFSETAIQKAGTIR